MITLANLFQQAEEFIKQQENSSWNETLPQLNPALSQEIIDSAKSIYIYSFRKGIEFGSYHITSKIIELKENSKDL